MVALGSGVLGVYLIVSKRTVSSAWHLNPSWTAYGLRESLNPARRYQLPPCPQGGIHTDGLGCAVEVYGPRVDRPYCLCAGIRHGRGAYSSAMHRYDGPGEGPDPLIARLPHQARNEHARVI